MSCRVLWVFAGMAVSKTAADASLPNCPDLPNVCGNRSSWTPDLVRHNMDTTDACVFSFDAPSDDVWSSGVNRARQLAELMGGPVAMPNLLSDLNRAGANTISSKNADRLKNHDWQGWQWNHGDADVTDWYPQGLTGSSDAVDEGLVLGRRLQLVSWYHKTEDRPAKGVRVSLADITDSAAIRYRHILLVVPYGDGADVNFRSVTVSDTDLDSLHAGGITWFGDYLYVADTWHGLRVFDMTLISKVSSTADKSAIGIDGGISQAHGYQYVLPQVARYDLSSGACEMVFSFVSLDRSRDPPSLLTGEYSKDSIQGRLVHWRLDPNSHKIEADGSKVHGVDGKMGAETKMQGAASWNGNYYISCSSQYHEYGRLYRTRPGLESSITAWPYGAEDLYYERSSELIWTLTEHPGYRDVVGIPLLTPVNTSSNAALLV